ncbi:prib protein [Moniliophthora roreri MCA 2997]|uniref:Prib protein n=1 Tax=Moniliophthora roreri (strain MCA 2997) TaxID=1381753 RepID=V2XEX9_MONRO|nr:prib protein [Moniliophthora roreri MCA 2997]
MPAHSYSYSSYYHHHHHHAPTPPYYDIVPAPAYPEVIPLSPQESEYPMSANQDPQSPNNIPIDPALALYPPYYSSSYQHHPQQHLSLPPSYSSPSSNGSDTIGTPPTETMYSTSVPTSNKNGKRPASSAGAADSRKKQKRDDESETAQSPATEKGEKPKPTRGSRACTVCRRLKMKCIGAEEGPPCKRCQAGGHECIFEESNRGKRSSKKHELLTRSLRKMEKTLDTVLRSIGNPSIASGMISRSPSPGAPSTKTTNTNALLDRSPSLGPMTTPTSSSTFNPPSNSHSFRSSQPHHSTSPKLHSLPDNALNPLGLLAEASLANRRAQQGAYVHGFAARSANGEAPKVGVASSNYFKPGPMTILPLRRLYIERQVQPEMLTFVTTNEVVEMFNIYYDHMNMHCNLLDRNFHTPSLVCSRSPFLLTTICAISSKFYTAKPELHPRLTELAKKLAFSVPGQGYKSVEIVQAYLLLTLWGCGAVERYEQDKTWMMLGMAIRMATDLNLHRKTAVKSTDTQEGRVRDMEVHNRERTWIMCFCLDRSGSALMGKPHSIREDYIIRNVDTWHKLPIAIPSDRSIAAYVELQRILSRSLDFLHSGMDTPSGLQISNDYMMIIKTFEAQILASSERHHNSEDHIQTSLKESPAINQYKHLIGQFYLNYVQLVINSYGLQDALERTPVNIGHFFSRCYACAMACSLLVRDHLGPSGFMKYSPDSHFVQTSYAVLTLLKLLRPEFSAYIEDESKIISIVRDVAEVLEKISVSPSHTPALYSTFLQALISVKTEANNGEMGLHLSTSSSDRDMQNNVNAEEIGALPFTGNSSVDFNDPSFMLNEFQMDSEMGPVADMSTFPPTMASPGNNDSPSMTDGPGMTMDSILSSGFWDSVLVPGYNSLDGLTGGFVFGAGGSGLITPRVGTTPIHSGQNTPRRSTSSGVGNGQNEIDHLNLAAVLEAQSTPS